MPKRILICRSNPISPDPRVEKIARALVNGGYSVHLVGWDMSGDYPEQEDIAGVPCSRLKVQAKFGRGLSNVWHQLRWQKALLIWLVQHRGEFDFIHACDFDTVLPSLTCKKLFGKKLIYDIFDFYADMLLVTPGVIKRLLRKSELKAINFADAVILADDSRRDQIKGSKPRRLEIIYNSPEDRVVAGEAQLVSLHNMKIAYTGGMTPDRGLYELVEVVGKHPEWQLDLAGYGVDDARIKAEARLMPNVTWHGRVPYEDALKINAEADVLVATYSPEIPNNRYASPNKLFEAMMLGKPIIVARDTNTDRIVEAEKCGMVVEYGNKIALEEALAKLSLDSRVRGEFGVKARQAFDRAYSWDRMEHRLLQLYSQVSS